MILTKDPKSVTMVEEVFGPVLTVYVYDDVDWEKTLELIDTTSQYGLTGSMYVHSTLTVLTRRLTGRQILTGPQSPPPGHQ